MSAGRGALRVTLADDLDPDLRALFSDQHEHIAHALAPWGRFTRAVSVCTVTSVEALERQASAPVDGPLCAVAEVDRIVLLAPRAWATPPTAMELRATLVHELAHSLLFQRCAPPGRAVPVALPTWFREGMAVQAAEGAPTAAVYRRLDPDVDIAALATADARLVGATAQRCYDVAHALFHSWFEEAGARRLGALCRRMREGRRFDEAFSLACGQPPSRWLESAAGVLRGRIGGA